MRLVALLLLAALPAEALVLDAACGVDPEQGRILPVAEPGWVIEVWPTPYPGDVAAFDWYEDGGRMQGFVQLCGPGEALRWAIGPTGQDDMRNRLHEMLDSDSVYSLGDLGRMIRGHGGRAWRAADPGACACDLLGF